MLRAAEVFSHNQKVETTPMSIDIRMDRQTVVYTHTVESHAAIKRKEILTHAATWMIHKNIMLSEH